MRDEPPASEGIESSYRLSEIAQSWLFQFDKGAGPLLSFEIARQFGVTQFHQAMILQFRN